MAKGTAHFRLGAHESIAEGFHMACRRGRDDGCEVIQIFTSSSRSWSVPKMKEGEIERWQEEVRSSGVTPFLVHDSYLINVASPKKRIRAASERMLKDELDRAEALGIPHVVMHPGAHMGEGEERALERITESILKTLDATKGHAVRIVLENTAGQGTTVGYKFEHLKTILDSVDRPVRMGVCLDTCHLFTSGYDISTPEGFRKTFDQFSEIVGLEHLKAFHLNDSKKPLHSRVDRHEHIGEGFIGKEAFRLLVNDERFTGLGGVLETPVRDGKRTFRDDLAVLRGLVG